MRPVLAALACLLVAAALSAPAGATGSACAIDDPSAARLLPVAPSLPPATLRSYGAAGDDRTDDTRALRAAFRDRSVCLDGEGRTYRVNGTLRAFNLCLTHATLRQTAEPMDTRPLIRSTKRPPPSLDASASVLYPEDKGLVTAAEHKRLNALNNLRTILVTADGRYQVYLADVRVLRGEHDALGAAGEAAGIYVAGADPVVMRDVEVTGHGRGNGILIARSSRVRLSGLNIHDLVWALEPGDRQFSLEDMRTRFRWNSVPIYVYDAEARQFAQVRSQEQANGLVIVGSDDVVVERATIDGVLYRSRDGLIPWQADGISIGNVSCLGIYDTTIARTWEGIDLTGQWVRNFRLANIEIRDSHAFGLKLVHAATDGVVDDLRVSHSGLAGVVVAGPVADVLLNDVEVRESGAMRLGGGRTMKPWAGLPGDLGDIAGISIGGNAAGLPGRIGLADAEVENATFPGLMRIGVRVHAARPAIAVSGVEVAGAREAALAGIAPAAVGFEALRALYRTAAGCEAELRALRSVWLDAQGSGPQPAWTAAETAARLARDKAQGDLACAAR